MNFISELQRKRCDYNHPDQATSQANSLNLLSSGIYTEEERFIFELLQNAVDAFNDPTGLLTIQMHIKDNYFAFLHNGDSFTKRDIEGLCDVGNGNKMKDAKKIGYKGIGFKSVFMKSSNVTVQSGGYCFKFDKDYWNNYWDEHWDINKYGQKDGEKKYLMPWQIIPIETEAPIVINMDDFNVATYINVSDTESLKQKVRRLLSSSQFLLFLKCPNIKIELVVDGKCNHWIEKNAREDIVSLSVNGISENSWLMYTNSEVPVPEELRPSIMADINTPDKLKESKTFDLSFAVEIDKGNKLKRVERAVLYTYLPTSYRFGSEGFPFLVNANFITDAGRQQLHKDSEWNKLIVSKIPSEFLTWLSMISLKYKNYWEILPERSFGRSNTLDEIYEAEMEKAIMNIAFVPTLSKKLVLAGDAVMDRMGLSSSISIETLIAHINRKYNKVYNMSSLVENVWKGSRILGDYGVFIFDKQKLKGIFEDENFFKALDVELDIKLVHFLFEYYLQNKSEQGELFSILQNTSFLLDENGVSRKPDELFFPSAYKEQNELAEDAYILHSKVNESIKNNSFEEKWLSELGINELSDVSFINNVICKKGYITESNSLEIMRFLFEVNKNINIFEKTTGLDNLLFLTKKGSLKKAKNLYLGSLYKPDVDIEKVYDDDIFVSDMYPGNDSLDEWSLFFKKLGVNGDLNLKGITLDETMGLTLLDDVKEEYEKLYNVGSWGSHFKYFFSNFIVYYAPFVLTANCSHDFLKIIWSSILSKEYKPESDIVSGYAGYWIEKRTFSFLGKENFMSWALRNYQKLPSTTKQLLPPTQLFQNTDEIIDIAGSYLPVLDIDAKIHDSWINFLSLKNTLYINDLLEILSKISHDISNCNANKDRICKIYQKIVELDGLTSESNMNLIKKWARVNTLLSVNDEFLNPSDLSYITLDGFCSQNRVYIGSPSNRDNVIKLMSLMGVRVITERNIKPQFNGKCESETLKSLLLSRLSPLALIATDEKPTKEEYTEKKKSIRKLISGTNFYHCDKIILTYGNTDDVIEKHTFGKSNEFYFIGDLRPANVEPLLTPLCKHLEIKGHERELFIMMIEDMEGVRQNLADKGYDITFLKDEPDSSSGTINTRVDWNRDESQKERDVITGFRGEIIVYEKLKSLGFNPSCPAISTEDDYTHKIVENGKEYYCKPNLNPDYDIKFTDNGGIQVFVEVKSTTTNVGQIENMPISAKEWSMIKRYETEMGKEYLLVRVFGIGQPSQDIYLFNGHTWNYYKIHTK